MKGFDFYKYQATGNDFVMLFAKQCPQSLTWSKEEIAAICHRQLGIGADGLIVLEAFDEQNEFDFNMHYWNQDGSSASFCGNGGRATTKFAYDLGLKPKSGEFFRFIAGDGPHTGRTEEDNEVSIQMKSVNQWSWYGADLLIDTGVPHRVHWLSDKETNWADLGRQLRFDPKLGVDGANVTFIKSEGPSIHMDTYERGVEDITLSCGTGVVASVLGSHLGKRQVEVGHFERQAITGAGMRLTVSYQFDGDAFTKVFLKGPATCIFTGRWSSHY